MKTILSLVLLLFVAASCSHPPPPQFEPYGSNSRAEEPVPAPPSTPKPAAVQPPAAAEPAPMAATPEAATPTNVVTPTVAETVTNAPELAATNAPPAPNFQTAGTPPSAERTPSATPPTTSPAPGQLSAGATLAAAINTNSQEIIPAGTIDFPATDLNQVLEIYGQLVNRTVLRPTALPAPTITLKTQTPLTKQEAIQAFDAVLAMNGIATINVGDKFVKVVPAATAGTEAAAPSTQSAKNMPDLGPYVTHVVQLKYVKPSEMVQVLTPFAKAPNSILPIDSSQILVLRDYTENVKRMLEMINKVDVAVPSEFISEVIPIKYAKATDIADALNSLSSGGGTTSVGRSSTGPGRTATGAAGYGRAGMPGGMTMPGATPFGAQGAAGAMPGQPGAAPNSFTSRLQRIIQRASASGELEILGTTKIIADERTNSLLIFATRQDMETIKNIVSKLDVVLAQVIIDSIIMDVQIGNSKEIGVSGLQTSKQYSKDPNVTGAGGYNNGQPVFDLVNFLTNSGTNTFFPGSLGGGLTYWGQLGNNFNLVLRAAASDSRINVIQKPRILTSHATPGSIFIGNTVPYVTSTYYGGGYAGGPSSSYQQLSVGIGLTVTPYINPDGLVVMQIDESIDEISGSTDITGVGAVPTTTSRRLSGEVAVRDGETIMLGGFIRNSTNKSRSGVPLLKDIPLLGPLFGDVSNTRNRSELVVLMRPTVLRTPEIAAQVTTEQKNRMPGISRAESEVRSEEQKELWKEMQRQEQQQKNSSKDPSSQLHTILP